MPPDYPVCPPLPFQRRANTLADSPGRSHECDLLHCWYDDPFTHIS